MRINLKMLMLSMSSFSLSNGPFLYGSPFLPWIFMRFEWRSGPAKEALVEVFFGWYRA